MELNKKLLTELQNRLKIGNRRGVHLNAIPSNSRYKFDLHRLSFIDENLPNNFIQSLLTDIPLKFRISWNENIDDLNNLFEEEQVQIVKITKAFENLINQTEAIESEKGINTFGFGFPLLVRRDKADNKLIVAPILIWNLKIKRLNEFNTWEISRSEDDPIYLNEVLINHIQSDTNIEIERLTNEMLEDGLIDKKELVQICSKLLNTINSSSQNDLTEIFNDKLNNVVSIKDKTHFEKLPINYSKSIIEFGGIFSIFEVQKQNIINEYDTLKELEGLELSLADMDNHSFQPISSVETDPSQQNILNSLGTKRNIIIQGPPGTGKSQTLTAVLINALENKKKTLVVCEKKTALEVLHNALIEKGLSSHCILIKDIVKDRKLVVDSVRDRYDSENIQSSSSFSYSDENLNNIINKANEYISSINNKHYKLDKKIIGNKSWTDLVGDLLKQLRFNTEGANLNLNINNFKYTLDEFNELLDLIKNARKYFVEYQKVEGKIINSKKLIGDNPFLIEQNLNDDFSSYALQIEQIKNIETKIFNEFKKNRIQNFEVQIDKINISISNVLNKEKEFLDYIQSEKDKYYKIRISEFIQQQNTIEEIIGVIDNVIISNVSNPDILNYEKVNKLKYKIFSLFSKDKKNTILDQKKLDSTFIKLSEIINNYKDFNTLNISGNLEEKVNLLNGLKFQIKEIKTSFDKKIIEEFSYINLQQVLESEFDNIDFNYCKYLLQSNSSNEFINIINSIIYNANSFITSFRNVYQELITVLDQCKDINIELPLSDSFPIAKDQIIDLKSKLNILKSEFEEKISSEFYNLNLLNINYSDFNLLDIPSLVDKVEKLTNDIKVNNWFIFKIKFNTLTDFYNKIDELFTIKNNYFNSEIDLFTIEYNWYNFYFSLNNEYTIIVDSLKDKNNWENIFVLYYLQSILTSHSSRHLPTNEDDHKVLNTVFNDLQLEQLKFVKDFWTLRQIEAGRNFDQNNNFSVRNLYNKKSSIRHKRLSLRQIIKHDASLFTDFFPVIFTSPDVASNLFQNRNKYFDIVMFDEASQLRLEDNLPSLLKGKQIVIAGDEHQMPPSNYFSKVFDGLIDDEEDIEEEKSFVLDQDNVLLSCESLLDFGTELNFHKKYLDFHYRSKHPFLIDFSNAAFYNQRLKPLPNIFNYTPIKYVQVNGTFSEHANEAEAEMVISILENNINKLPNGNYPSVGIATFNIAQRNLIKSKIIDRQKLTKYDSFNKKIQDLESNGFFIKNLENIQGDERDVIILSTTYGVDKDGKFNHRFGPINHSKGYKLLNVIVTRAKYKIYCCTSIPENVFLNFNDFLITEGSNNKKAVFFSYLAYCKAVSDSDNELRKSILNALIQNTQLINGNTSTIGLLESPFEEEVYNYLLQEFDSKKLIPQFQFAGFRIDLVYDSKIPGVPKIAIECDGAKYHSSHEVYLYDRHRQKILEGCGFVFHRIWSTNWWRNPNRELKKLVNYIKHVESNIVIEDISIADFTTAFSDELVNFDEQLFKNSILSSKSDEVVINSLDESLINSVAEPNKEVIKLNSKVRIKYLNNDKIINIFITDLQINSLKIVNGIQYVNVNTPLAKSLISHSVGDNVKIGKLDNYVDILEIVNDRQ